MRWLLSRVHQDTLARFAWSNVLVAFDFDGTLAPIVDERGHARMRAETRRLLHAVATRYPCAVISGRARDDVAQRVAGLPIRFVVGNHGLEPGLGTGRFQRMVADAIPRIERRLGDAHQGVEIEDKRYSLAVHYRRSRRKRIAVRAILQAIQSLPQPMRVIPGKMVVNAVPEGAPHKGMALERLRDVERADTALYVGDDVTDEDVFQLDQPGRLLCARVGWSRESAAPYYLRAQTDIDLLLRRLVALRSNGRAVARRIA